jgi:hypothetical protein
MQNQETTLRTKEETAYKANRKQGLIKRWKQKQKTPSMR